MPGATGAAMQRSMAIIAQYTFNVNGLPAVSSAYQLRRIMAANQHLAASAASAAVMPLAGFCIISQPAANLAMKAAFNGVAWRGGGSGGWHLAGAQWADTELMKHYWVEWK